MIKVLTCFWVLSISQAATLIQLNGATKVLTKDLVLESGSKVIGPGVLKVKSSSSGIIVSGNDVIIENIVFQVEDNTKKHNSVIKLSQGVQNVQILKNKFLGARYSILKADINTKLDKELKFKKRASNITFQNNECLGQYSRHLYLASIKNLLISNNTFRNSLRDSIRLRQNIVQTKIIGNSFISIGKLSKESSDGVDSYWSGEELIISNNIFDGISTHGVDIKGISPDMNSKSSKVIITNNIFKNIQYCGVLLSSGSYVQQKKNLVENFIISSNQFLGTNLNNKNPNDAAIFIRHGVKDVIVNSNIIKAKQSHGIVIGGFEKRVEQTSGVLISSNIIETKFSPVYIVASKNILITNNDFKKKKVKQLKKRAQFTTSNLIINNNL